MQRSSCIASAVTGSPALALSPGLLPLPVAEKDWVTMTLTGECFSALTNPTCCFNAICVLLIITALAVKVTPGSLRPISYSQRFSQKLHIRAESLGSCHASSAIHRFKHNRITLIFYSRNARGRFSSQIHSNMFDIGLNQLSKATFVMTIWSRCLNKSE